MDALWNEIATSSSSDEYDEDSDGGGDGVTGGADDPTYELACLRRANQKTEKLGGFVNNIRGMFILQVKAFSL